jgi:tetratricopeptide (TPR) repeat protein
MITLGESSLVLVRRSSVEACADATGALAALMATGDVEAQEYLCRLLAEQDILQGRPAHAHTRLLPLAARLREGQIWLARLLSLLAWACLDLGEPERAASLAGQAVAQATAQRARPSLADALRIQALVAMRTERWQEAEAALEEALAVSRGIPYPYAEAKALYVYGQLHAARGAPERARECYAQALGILARVGERLYAAHVERALAEVE